MKISEDMLSVNTEEKLFNLCEEKQNRVTELEQLLKKVLKAIRSNCFIIPKDGEKRDRAIGVLDEIKEVLGLKGSEGGED